MSPAVIISVIAGVSLGVTVVVLLIRGSYLLGKLVNRVENQDAKIDNLGTRIDRVTTAVNELRADIQQTNQAIHQTNKILVGLANHTHDADGRTVFPIPQ